MSVTAERVASKRRNGKEKASYEAEIRPQHPCGLVKLSFDQAQGFSCGCFHIRPCIIS